jgi:hypothetical protein
MRTSELIPQQRIVCYHLSQLRALAYSNFLAYIWHSSTFDHKARRLSVFEIPPKLVLQEQSAE